jgi:hypothetical protein
MGADALDSGCNPTAAFSPFLGLIVENCSLTAASHPVKRPDDCLEEAAW